MQYMQKKNQPVNIYSWITYKKRNKEMAVGLALGVRLYTSLCSLMSLGSRRIIFTVFIVYSDGLGCFLEAWKRWRATNCDLGWKIKTFCQPRVASPTCLLSSPLIHLSSGLWIPPVLQTAAKHPLWISNDPYNYHPEKAASCEEWTQTFIMYAT